MENNIITVANKLLRASYSLTLNERRLMLALVANIDNKVYYTKENLEHEYNYDGTIIKTIRTKIQVDTTELEVLVPDKFYVIDARSFADLFNLDLRAAKLALKEAIEGLAKAEIHLRSPEVIHRISWVYEIFTYDKETTSVGLKWSPSIIPLISELQANFTSYKIKWATSFSCMHSGRWYEYLVSYLNESRRKTWVKDIYLEDIKIIFKLEGRYSIWNDFKKRVLDEAFKEINEKTDLYVRYVMDRPGKIKYIKEGKRIIGFWLEVGRKEKEELRKIGLV